MGKSKKCEYCGIYIHIYHKILDYSNNKVIIVCKKCADYIRSRNIGLREAGEYEEK